MRKPLDRKTFVDAIRGKFCALTASLSSKRKKAEDCFK